MNLFDENEDITNELLKKAMSGVVLTGEEAAALLAYELASQTHGNYTPETLYSGAGLSSYYELSIKRKETK